MTSSSGNDAGHEGLRSGQVAATIKTNGRVSRRELTQLCRYGLIQECYANYRDGHDESQTARIIGWSGEAEDPLLHLVDSDTDQRCDRWASEVSVFRCRIEGDHVQANSNGGRASDP